MKKKLIGLLIIPIVFGGLAIGIFAATQTHAAAQTTVTSVDKPEPGDTPDKPSAVKSDTDTETND